MVAMVRRLCQMRRVGHAGTLDPFATGLLVVMIGQATKLSNYLTGVDKEYSATLKWGAATDTCDHTGQTVATSDTSLPPRAEIERVLAEFVGPLEQIPPMFSAKKVDGKALHTLARQGKEVERRAQLVMINALELLAYDADAAEFTFRVHCSKGTYVRTLADVLARELGGFGHLSALRRDASGRFDVSDAVTADEAKELAQAQRLTERLIPLDNALDDMPAVVLTDAAAKVLANGIQPGSADIVDADAVENDQTVRVIDARGTLLALARTKAPAERWSDMENSEKILSLLRVFPQEGME